MANSVDPDQTAPIGTVCSGTTLFASILNLSVMLGNNLQQTISADYIFRCFFFLGALRVNRGEELLVGRGTFTTFFTHSTHYCCDVTVNPFKPNEIPHSYQLDKSISVLRVVGWYFSFLFKF